MYSFVEIKQLSFHYYDLKFLSTEMKTNIPTHKICAESIISNMHAQNNIIKCNFHKSSSILSQYIYLPYLPNLTNILINIQLYLLLHNEWGLHLILILVAAKWSVLIDIN